MANDLATAAATAQNQTHIDRVTAAAVYVATQVLPENPGQWSTSPANTYRLRISLARNVIDDPVSWGKRWAWALIFDDRARVTTVDDATLVLLITESWSYLAGANVP